MRFVRTHHRLDVPEKKPLFDDTVSCFSRDPSDVALDEIVMDIETEEQLETNRESEENPVFRFDGDEEDESVGTSSSERSLDETEQHSHYLYSTQRNGTHFLQFLQLSSSSCGSISENATSSTDPNGHLTNDSLSRDDRDDDANFANTYDASSPRDESVTDVSLYCSSSMPSSPEITLETIAREPQFDANELSVRLNELLANSSIVTSNADTDSIETCYAFSEYFDLYELFDIVV